MTDTCPLCEPIAEVVAWRDARCRVIVTPDADYPAFCRVVWQLHVAEMTDLDAAGRDHLFRVVLAVEAALRSLLAPDKINLASLGNQVPHLHWHVIPRFRDDAHYPDPVWAPRRRSGVQHALDRDAFSRALQSALG